MRPEREVLKHEPDSTLVCGDGVSCWCSHSSAIQPDLPAVRLFETCNEPEEGRLSRAAGSDDDHAFPGGATSMLVPTSPNARMNTITHVATRPTRICGSTIYRIVCGHRAPATAAASS